MARRPQLYAINLAFFLLLGALCSLVVVSAAALSITNVKQRSPLRDSSSGACSYSVAAAIGQESTVRGGAQSDTVASSDDDRLLQDFLSTCQEDEAPSESFSPSSFLDRFHIHGWRWHTLSLARESGRLLQLANRSELSQADSLQEAADYVVGFNLKGLHKIEADLFFPWMREKLSAIPDALVSEAFKGVMDELESDRRIVAELGESIKKSVVIACDASKEESLRIEAIKTVAESAASLQGCAKRMIHLEDTWLVPGIAKIVPESEQKSFNNRVLRNLGILDSRLHLVAMYEAVEESKDSKEKALFEQAIPSLPQMMIPRWKRKLYEPKTSVLNV